MKKLSDDVRNAHTFLSLARTLELNIDLGDLNNEEWAIRYKGCVVSTGHHLDTMIEFVADLYEATLGRPPQHNSDEEAIAKYLRWAAKPREALKAQMIERSKQEGVDVFRVDFPKTVLHILFEHWFVDMDRLWCGNRPMMPNQRSAYLYYKHDSDERDFEALLGEILEAVKP